MNKKIILQKEVSINVVGFTTPTITDDRLNKKVTAKFNYKLENEQQQECEPIELWVGEAYDAIGQYTDSDVDQRITEILNTL